MNDGKKAKRRALKKFFCVVVIFFGATFVVMAGIMFWQKEKTETETRKIQNVTERATLQSEPEIQKEQNQTEEILWTKESFEETEETEQIEETMDSYHILKEPLDINGITYLIENDTVYAWEDGKKTVVIGKCAGEVLMNETYIYYCLGGAEREMSIRGPIYEDMTLYRYHIKERITEELFYDAEESLMCFPIACDGRYLYMGNSTQYGGTYMGLRVFDLETGETVFTDCTVGAGEIEEIDGKLLVSAVNYPHGANLCLMNKDGTGIQNLSDAPVVQKKVTDSYIFFKEATFTWEMRQCRCNRDGSNKVNLTEWTE